MSGAHLDGSDRTAETRDERRLGEIGGLGVDSKSSEVDSAPGVDRAVAGHRKSLEAASRDGGCFREAVDAPRSVRDRHDRKTALTDGGPAPTPDRPVLGEGDRVKSTGGYRADARKAGNGDGVVGARPVDAGGIGLKCAELARQARSPAGDGPIEQHAGVVIADCDLVRRLVQLERTARRVRPVEVEKRIVAPTLDRVVDAADELFSGRQPGGGTGPPRFPVIIRRDSARQGQRQNNQRRNSHDHLHGKPPHNNCPL